MEHVIETIKKLCDKHDGYHFTTMFDDYVCYGDLLDYEQPFTNVYSRVDNILNILQKTSIYPVYSIL